MPMDSLHHDSQWLILPAMAVSFLIWVLWNWWREEKRSRLAREATAQDWPAPSSAFRDAHRRDSAAGR
jgi:hypothetical protein